MRQSTIQPTFVAAALLFLAGCGGALPGGGPGMSSGRGGSPGITGIGNFGGSATGAGGLGQGGGMNCPDGPAKLLPADVLIVLDASAAMNDDAADMPCSGGCGASSKWTQTVAAIERLVGETEMTVNWGLKLFPDSGTACAVGGSVTVPVGPAHAAAIVAAIRERTSPNGGVIAGGSAPIREAANSAAAYLAGLTDAARKVILLATAGAPTCLPGESDPAVGDADGSAQAITNARNSGLPTTVLGIAAAGEPAESTLNKLAIAGGQSRAGLPYYTPIANVAELTSGLNTLLGISPACVLALPPTGDGSPRLIEIGVLIDGVPIARDRSHMNGWDYVDATETSVEVYGPACETLGAGPSHTATIIFHCGILP